MKRTRVRIASRQHEVPVPSRLMREIIRSALAEHGMIGSLDVAVVDDREIMELNKRFLQRDTPTDVLAFPYARQKGYIEGEIVLNAQQAVREAAGRPHGKDDEMLLYVLHGLLHLLGYDDASEKDRIAMRREEKRILDAAGRRVEY